MVVATDGNRAKPSVRWNSRHRARAGERGLKRQEIDVERVRKLSAVGMPVLSIARRLGFSDSSFSDEKKKNPDVEDAIIAGQYEFEEGLRTTQARLALSGHAGMLIWLGKQFLGQSDKQETKQETTVNVVLQKAMQEVRELDRDTLEQMKQLLEDKRATVIENE